MISCRRFLFFGLFILVVQQAVGQVPLRDNPEAVAAIKVTLDHIYNFEFDEALSRIDSRHGLGIHPANAVINAVLIYWRDSPLVPGSENYLRYEDFLNRAVELSRPFLEEDDLFAEGAFYSLAGYGLLTELYSEEGAGFKVLNMAKKAYKYLKIGKGKMVEIPDFYFSTGLYNYYREKYPELHPFYKSFMWLFESGDKSLGIDQLKSCAEEGIFARNEALIYLFHIYMRYENNPAMAYTFASRLNEKFPQNLKFSCHLAEVLIAMDELAPAEKICRSLLESDRTIFRLCGTLFRAMILEKKGRLNEAEKLLEQSLELHDSLNKPDFHFLSMIYATQARIAVRRNNHELAEERYRKALKSSPYMPVLQEAEEYLGR